MITPPLLSERSNSYLLLLSQFSKTDVSRNHASLCNHLLSKSTVCEVYRSYEAKKVYRYSSSGLIFQVMKQCPYFDCSAVKNKQVFLKMHKHWGNRERQLHPLLKMQEQLESNCTLQVSTCW